jgi:hypothetical protein
MGLFVEDEDEMCDEDEDEGENKDRRWERGYAMRARTYGNYKDGIADNDEEKVEMFAVARCCDRA